ncbi:DUF2321 domain-containing protein [Sporomusa sphaeroides]|uniref:DUF2321 domain-containing protein n=1 Tax=Sporomusa sphaeroides TaxID=47679 RepID=UPI003D9FBCC7
MAYHIAQICLSGHVINDKADEFPQYNQNFCEICGKTTITTCQHCGSKIRGQLAVTWMAADVIQPYSRPAFCAQCGKPYQWTEAAIKAAEEAIELMDELEPDDKKRFKENISDIISQTPRTKVAAKLIKRFLDKVAPGTGELFRQTVINLTVEGVKQLIWPQLPPSSPQ